MTMISPSILSADFSALGEDVKEVCEIGIDYLHIDVMDGMFVPNISFGADIMKSLNKITTVPYDVHLMITEPLRYIEKFATDNTEFITIHYEACEDMEKTLDYIHSLGLKAGVSLKPGTNMSVLDNYLDKIDLILVMSVEPGFGGQKFMPDQVEKIKYFYKKRKENSYKYVIEVDGGIGAENAHIVKEAGVDIIVAGSAVFKAVDRKKVIESIRE